MNISLELEHLKTEKIRITVSTGSTNCTGVVTGYSDTHIILTQSSKTLNLNSQWVESGVKSIIAIDKIGAIVYEFTKEA